MYEKKALRCSVGTASALICHKVEEEEEEEEEKEKRGCSDLGLFLCWSLIEEEEDSNP